MRNRSVATAAVLALGLAVSPAVAAEKPKPNRGAEARMLSTQPKMTPQELYKAQMQQYLDAVETRRVAVDEINRAFTTAVKRAQKTFKAARSSAATAEEKINAEAVRKAAIAAATTARQAAIDALPPLPTKPVKPLPPQPSPAPTSTESPAP